MRNCYVVIVNYKRWEDTVDCLRSVFASDYSSIKALVVDNCSGNESLQHISQTFIDHPLSKADGEGVKAAIIDGSALTAVNFAQMPDLLLIQHERNDGFAAGNNLVLQYLQNQEGFVFLLNPDMTVDPRAITELVESASLHTSTILGLVTKSSADKEKLLFYGGGRVSYVTATVRMVQQWTQVKQLDYISGGALFTNSSCFRQLGLLPEQYFLYWEETDWCVQAVKEGFHLDVCVRAICYDKISTVIGRGFQSDYYYTRNGLLFLNKYARWWLPTAIFSALIRVGIRMFMGQWLRAKGVLQGVNDFLTGNHHGRK